MTRSVYGVDGELVLRADGEETVLLFGETELRLKRATGAVSALRRYPLPGGGSATRSSTSRIDYMVGDLNGSALVSIEGSSGAVTRRFAMPFGEARGGPVAPGPLGAGGGWPDERGFLGKLVDGSSGLTSVGARQYDASAGRFISVDPLLDAFSPGQMLGYSYGDNNPLAFPDPSGLMRADSSGTGYGSSYVSSYSSANAAEHRVSQPVASATHSQVASGSRSGGIRKYGSVSVGQAIKKAGRRFPGAVGDFAAGVGGGLLDIFEPITTGMAKFGCLAYLGTPRQAACYNADVDTPAEEFLGRKDFSEESSAYKAGYIFSFFLPLGGGAGSAPTKFGRAAGAAERGLSKAARGVRSARAANAGDDVTRLYRAVDPAELKDIAGTGVYRSAPGGTEGKYFFPTAEQAENFSGLMGKIGTGPYCVTSGCIPRSTLDGIETIHPAGEGTAYFIPRNLLPQFKDIIIHAP